MYHFFVSVCVPRQTWRRIHSIPTSLSKGVLTPCPTSTNSPPHTTCAHWHSFPPCMFRQCGSVHHTKPCIRMPSYLQKGPQDPYILSQSTQPTAKVLWFFFFSSNENTACRLQVSKLQKLTWGCLNDLNDVSTASISQHGLQKHFISKSG